MIPAAVRNIRISLGVCQDCGRDHRAEVLATATMNGLKLLEVL